MNSFEILSERSHEYFSISADEWDEGSFNGVCARGAFEISMEWKNKKILKASVLSKAGGICTINPKIPVKVTSEGRKISVTRLSDGVIQFKTRVNSKYDLEIEH